MIIEWIENNRDVFISFFGDDDINNITKEEQADYELECIKTKNSCGTHYTIAITCLLFNLIIAIYIYDGNSKYSRSNIFYNNKKNDSEIMILSFHNNNYFDLIYSTHENIEKTVLNLNISEVKINRCLKNKDIKFTGIKFERKYVECKFKNSTTLYDEIFEFLKSIESHKEDIAKLVLKYPNQHYNQILSQFPLKYPKRLDGNDPSTIQKRKIFRKNLNSYILNENMRLCVINPLNRDNESNVIYKIPYKHEKEILINDNHSNYNHCGRIATLENLNKEKWYWFGITNDVQNYINLCPFCNNSGKYKKLHGKNKIIIDNGPHYPYIVDLWTIPKIIAKNTNFKYIIDIVDHFSKWYYGYLLTSKKAEEVFNKIEIFIENFGKPKILQVDNGGEFDNRIIKNYCTDNNIIIVHSSPYHPQTNGACEATHKEIRKYICNDFLKYDKKFDISNSLFNIIKIHNNKTHTTTKRIPKEIRDLDDINIIKDIQKEIVKTLERKNKAKDKIDFDKKYVLDDKNIIISNNKILNNEKKKKKVKSNKIPIIVISNIVDDNYYIEIKKTIGLFEDGEIYEINIDLLEEVNEIIWNKLFD